MKPLTAAEIRRRYLKFFEEQGHKIMASDSLVPANDPTLLFTGAGMNQFKDMFLGKGTLPHRRVTTSQKCLRVPDLENVGFTARHHTFFEMLGNFSFGDYFKKECIAWIWSFFKDVCGIPGEQMVVTIYQDDDEAFEIWTKVVGLSPDKVFRFGEKENFWPAEAPSKGPNGPCGPCSEIYFDSKPGQPYPAKLGLESLPDDRFTEVGNCVFTQFDRQSDGTLKPLPQRNIDVGLGLERIAAVLQGAKNNFETELFRPYLDHLGKVSGSAYGGEQRRDIRMRRIADHVRAITFCIADGALPSNEGRGYVVRKILRRAARDGYELGLQRPFLFEMVDLVGGLMGDQYPEVRENAGQCRAVIKAEEENFLTVYRQGMARLDEFLAAAKKPAAGANTDGSGDFAFTLHDTYGFPVDITSKVMEERGHRLDEAGFEAAMEAQRARARASMATTDAVFTASVAVKLRDQGHAATQFVGYEVLQAATKLVALVGEGDVLLPRAAVGQRVLVVAATSPFYAQGGGQVGDRGRVTTTTGRAVITNTTALDGFHLHQAMVESGHLEAGQPCELQVDEAARRATERNHTATHLLHAALRRVLGDHVSQAGSEVSPDRLRFDYTQPEKPSAEQLQRVEDLVNGQILLAHDVAAVVRNLDEARANGFMALFGEKYGERVRTLQVGDFSKELCGGTHVRNSGNIGSFRIVTETAVAAGTRRLEAVTGLGALELARQERLWLGQLATALKVPVARVGERVAELSDELKKTRKELEKALAPDLDAELQKLRGLAADHAGSRTVVYVRPGLQAKDAQELLRRAQQALDPFAGVVLSPGAEDVQIVVAVSPALTSRVKAGDLVKALATLLGGGGGGRPEAAQGKGKDVGKVEAAAAAAAQALAAAGLRA
ncbi:MAG: alanine--tRNA ligase [Planctomycetes bacterium]|nr:alanine--tRNA ligase [Planctomycetota bacterium]MCC7396984.1 alanine--tRNA ligase [Planctomycetota bacterium]